MRTHSARAFIGCPKRRSSTSDREAGEGYRTENQRTKFAKEELLMLKLTSDGNCHRTACKTVQASVLAATICAGVAVPWGGPTSAQGEAKDRIPELASATFAWLAQGADWLDPPAGLRGPVRNDPDHRFHGNLDGPGQVTVRMGNWRDPCSSHGPLRKCAPPMKRCSAASGRCPLPRKPAAIRAAFPGNCSIRRSRSISSRRRRSST